jgi:hypothetical protein
MRAGMFRMSGWSTGRRRLIMNIYFSCSLTGGRKDEAIYGALVDHLLANGHEIPTAHLARSEVMDEEKVIDPQVVYHRDIAWIEACDIMIAEVSTPSHGVGYEIAHALHLGKPVLCCHREGAPVSKMITGNSSRHLIVRPYRDLDHALRVVGEFADSHQSR